RFSRYRVHRTIGLAAEESASSKSSRPPPHECPRWAHRLAPGPPAPRSRNPSPHRGPPATYSPPLPIRLRELRALAPAPARRMARPVRPCSELATQTGLPSPHASPQTPATHAKAVQNCSSAIRRPPTASVPAQSPLQPARPAASRLAHSTHLAPLPSAPHLGRCARLRLLAQRRK